jgi:4-alpha-glucanotransferase
MSGILLFDSVIAVARATARERFEAFARSGRDILSQRWTLTENTYERENPKRMYYLSMEFLIGRPLANHVTNLLLDDREGIVAALLRLVWFSQAALAIAPLQDLLNLGAGARMNVPGRAEGNWSSRRSGGHSSHTTLVSQARHETKSLASQLR